MPPIKSTIRDYLALSPKKIATIIGALILLVIIAIAVMTPQEPEFKFVEVSGKGIYEAKGPKLFDAFIGSEEDKSEITFEVDGKGVSYKIPFKEVNWKRSEDGSVQATSGNEIFRYGFITDKGKAIGLKTEFILKKKPSHNVYTSPMDLKGAKRTRKVGSRKFYNKSDEEIFHFVKPVMTDKNNQTSDDFHLRITKSQIALVPSKKWLGAEEREYPVVIDMSFKVSTSVIEAAQTEEE